MCKIMIHFKVAIIFEFYEISISNKNLETTRKLKSHNFLKDLNLISKVNFLRLAKSHHSTHLLRTLM